MRTWLTLLCTFWLALSPAFADNTANADEHYLALRDELATLRQEATLALDAINAPQWRSDTLPPEALSRAAQLMQQLSGHQAERVALFHQLSPALQARLSGFTPEGLERIEGEIQHLVLMARWYPTQRSLELQRNVSSLGDIFQAGYLGMLLLQLAATLWLLRWLYMRTPQGLQSLRQWLAQQSIKADHALRVERLLLSINSLRRELLILAGVYVVGDVLLASKQHISEWHVLTQLAYTYAWFALALAGLHRIVLTALSRYRAVSPTLSLKIRRSLRLVIRLALFITVYLILAQALLGRGALYGIAVNVATIGALGVAWRLIHNWRSEVASAYLAIHPEGRLADLVRAHQDQTYGLLIVAWAFFFVAALGLWVWLRDTALRFEQTRKALAYLFRRQLERRATAQMDERDTDELPEALRTAFDGDVLVLDDCIDFFPKLTQVLARSGALREGNGGGLVAISGERGAGKTTWLKRFLNGLPSDLSAHYLSIDERITRAEQTPELLAKLLGLAADSSPGDCVRELRNGPPRVIVLDLAQNLMLRDVGGLAAYEALLLIAQATQGSVLWVLSFASQAFRYLQHNYPHRDVYDQHIELAPWPEQRIGELIESRLAQVGYSANYDGLVSHAMLQQELHSHEPSDERVADRYLRLIWDYADGNPRLALHFFAQSLLWTGGNSVRVQLFPMPALTPLEAFADQTHYVLACLMLHENLTADEAARSLRFPTSECARALALLQQQGYLSVTKQQRYRVETHWNRAVLRLLQRKKLLET